MGNIKDLIEETRELADKNKKDTKNNCIERVQYSYQEWALRQMINAIDFVERVRNTINQKKR